jgi:hypothetical protein
MLKQMKVKCIENIEMEKMQLKDSEIQADDEMNHAKSVTTPVDLKQGYDPESPIVEIISNE